MGDINKRMIIMCLVAFVVVIAAILKLCFISLAHGQKIREAVDNKAYITDVVTAFGGNLLGDNANDLLAYCYPSCDIRWNAVTAKKNIPNLTLDTLKYLADDFDKYFLEKNGGKSYYPLFKKAYQNGLTNQLIMRDVHKEEETRVSHFRILRESKGGLVIDHHTDMIFTSDKISTRTLGKTNLDDETNKVGIIGAYRDTLMGKTMKRDMFHGNVLPAEISDQIFPDKGRDVVSTINYNLSESVYDALYAEMKRVKAGKGCAIVMDVETGDVKAMINLTKSYRSDTIFSEQTNIAFANTYEPGSVFKLASFVVALKDGVINLDDEMSIGTGRMHFPGKDVVDSHIYSSEQVWSLRKIFAMSSNIGAAKVVYNNYKSNPQKFVDGLHALHLDDYVKTDILSSSRSQIKNTDSENWWQTSLYQMAQGYEVMITPINLAMFYNAIANGGVMMRPRFVSCIIDNEHDKVINFDPVVVDTICNDSIARLAKSILREVVTTGTAANVFKNAKYAFCGKTGTAQIRASKVYSATFIGFFPEEKPKYTIYVMLSDLYGEYYAASVAAPVVRRIADVLYETTPCFYETMMVDIKTPNVWNELSKK